MARVRWRLDGRVRVGVVEDELEEIRKVQSDKDEDEDEAGC